MAIRAFVVRCPHCNANLQVQGTAVSTTCAYCGTVSRIQPRTAVFQIPKPPVMPPPSPGMSSADHARQLQELSRMPVAVQRPSTAVALVPALLMVAVIGGGVFVATFRAKQNLHHASPASAPSAPAVPAVPPTSAAWSGDRPALTDVDGDGTIDIVGMTRYSSQGDRVHLAAFSGKTGTLLWESPAIGTYGDLDLGDRAAIGKVLYVATGGGELRGYDLSRAGAELWRLPLGEKIRTLCVRGAELVVATADSKWWAIDPAGTKREGKPLFRFDNDFTQDHAPATFLAAGPEGDRSCIPAAWTHASIPGRLSLRVWTQYPDIEGMNAELLVKHPGGPVVVIGSKTPGTSVPMLAALEAEAPAPRGKARRFKWPAVRWTAQVPSTDPLNSRLDAERVTLDQKAVYAVYETKGSVFRLAAFDLATGQRSWERQLPDDRTPTTVAVFGDTVVLVSWSAVRAFAAADGSERYRIGGTN